MPFELSDFFMLLLFGSLGFGLAIFYVYLLMFCLDAAIGSFSSSYPIRAVNATLDEKTTITFRAGLGTLYRLAYRVGNQDHRCQALVMEYPGPLGRGSQTFVYVSEQDPRRATLSPPSIGIGLTMLCLAAVLLWVGGMCGTIIPMMIEHKGVNPTLLLVSGVFLILLFTWLLSGTGLHKVFFAPVARVFFRKSQGVIRDYYVYEPDPTTSEFTSNLPVVIATVEGTHNGHSYRLDCPAVDADSLMRSLDLPEQLPTFWYEKSEWDQLLLGQLLTVWLSPDLTQGILNDEYQGNRRMLICWLLAILLFIGSIAVGAWLG